MHPRSPGRATATPLVLALLAAMGATASAAAAAPTAVSVRTDVPAPVAVDGLSMSTAAASCWEIKQADPAAVDGVYWLQTPSLVAPEQFYCDQTTDGGGWVLIGRGREGWSYYSEGKGTAAEVRKNVTGQAAYDTKQLSAATIDGLLDGKPVDDLTDPVRVRRVTDKAGSAWQEVRFTYAKNRVTGWTWALGGQIPLASYSFDGVAGTGGTSAAFGSSGRNVLSTSIQSSATDYLAGMGLNVAGGVSASSAIWSRGEGGTPGLPFAQMYLRPRVMTADTAYPAATTDPIPESALRSLMSDRALDSTWGVTGLANGDPAEAGVEISAFAQVGDVMYVGGNFTHAIKNGSTATKQSQPYLAAFDVNTTEWISTFRPVLDNQVKALYALPSGELLVGGQFTKVNGADVTGLVALDPTTGKVSDTYKVGVTLTKVSDINVRGFDRQGDWLYLAGRFSRLWGGSRTAADAVLAGNGGRINIHTGEPDYSWNPRLNGGSWDVSASDQGDRVYYAGKFSASGTTATDRAAALSSASTDGATPLAVIPWVVDKSAATHYEQAIHESGDTVFVGGAEHQLVMYDRATMTKTGKAISLAGGDFQVIAEQDGVIYAGNHGLHFIYTNGQYYSSPSGIGPWTDVHKFSFTGAWDAKNLSYIPDFDPMLKGRRDNGTWALTFDTNGTMWMGGDFTSAVGSSGSPQWVGAFVRFPERDDVVPTTPTQAHLARGVLSWSASTDDRKGTVSYEVLVNGRVRHTTTHLTATLADVEETDIVMVRAVDAAGNRSRSTAPVPSVFARDDELTMGSGTAEAAVLVNDSGEGIALHGTPVSVAADLEATALDNRIRLTSTHVWAADETVYTTTVGYTIVDSSGATSDATLTVHVVRPPVVSGPTTAVVPLDGTATFTPAVLAPDRLAPTNPVVTSPPAAGTATVGPDGTVVVDTTGAGPGTLGLTVTYTDALSQQTTVSFQVTVQGPPVVTGETAVVPEGGSHTFTTPVATGGTIVDATTTSSPDLTVTAAVDGTITVDASAAGPGDHTFDVTFTDDLGQATTTAYTITVQAAPLVSGTTSDRIAQDASATFDMTVGAGLVATATVTTAPSAGTVTAVPGGTVTFDAATAAPGTYTFAVTFADAYGQSTETRFTVDVQARPVATGGEVTVPTGGTHTFTTDVTPTEHLVSAAITTAPAAGTATLGAGGGLRYEAGDAPAGSSTIEVTYLDDLGQRAVAVYTVSVQAPPSGAGTDTQVALGTPEVVIAPLTDVRGTALTLLPALDPIPDTQGTAAVVDDTLVVTPAAGFVGTIAIPVTIVDDLGQALTITMTVTVLPEPVAPTQPASGTAGAGTSSPGGTGPDSARGDGSSSHGGLASTGAAVAGIAVLALGAVAAGVLLLRRRTRGAGPRAAG